MISLTIGDKLIALCWSFSNPHSEDPYSIALRPGAKPRLICTCPSFSMKGKGRTCKHVSMLRDKVRDDSILQDPHFKLTPEGLSYFRLEET